MENIKTAFETALAAAHDDKASSENNTGHACEGNGIACCTLSHISLLSLAEMSRFMLSEYRCSYWLNNDFKFNATASYILWIKVTVNTSNIVSSTWGIAPLVE
jgi:hypothetical protein